MQVKTVHQYDPDSGWTRVELNDGNHVVGLNLNLEGATFAPSDFLDPYHGPSLDEARRVYNAKMEAEHGKRT